MKNILIIIIMGLASTYSMASKLAREESGNDPAAALDKTRYLTRAQDASIIWTGSKITGGSHTGTLALQDHSLEFLGRDLVGGFFTIDMNSMETTDLRGASAEKLIGHLKSDDFFDVSTYPTSTFTLTTVEEGMEPGVYEVNGDLTIKSTTQSIHFRLRLDWKENQAIARAFITVNRADFDVRYGSGSFFDNLGDRAIRDEFTLDVRIVTENWDQFIP